MGLTPNMIKIIKDKIIPDLKREYGVKNKDEFRKKDIDLSDGTGSFSLKGLPEEDVNRWMKTEMELFLMLFWPEEIEEEELIKNWVLDWLIDEDW
tara:strand:+ start:207 stop:491 length:285 start_codon:yes stop_codon:yes gene_type:complete